MGKVVTCLTVYFEKPFWVGVFEITDSGKLSVSKNIFGAEPKDFEILEFVLNWYSKLNFSPSVLSEETKIHKNPKRALRDAKKQVSQTGIGTKAQQAFKLWQEQSKTERKNTKKEKKLEKEQRIFELKQQKKKEKHRGR